MTQAEFSARVAARTSMPKLSADGARECRVLDRRQFACQRRARENRQFRNLLDEIVDGAPGPHSPDRRQHRHHGLDYTHLRGRQDPSRGRQLSRVKFPVRHHKQRQSPPPNSFLGFKETQNRVDTILGQKGIVT